MAPLRKKAAKAKARLENKSASQTGRVGKKPASILAPDRNAFLHQAKITKKEKRDVKRDGFLSQLSAKHVSELSKSSRRRLNRKKKGNLNTSLNDLLDTLDPETLSSQTNGYIPPKLTPLNPKKSSKAQEKVLHHEIQNFNSVIAKSDFHKNPFASLKSIISANATLTKTLDKAK